MPTMNFNHKHQFVHKYHGLSIRNSGASKSGNCLFAQCPGQPATCRICHTEINTSHSTTVRTLENAEVSV